MFRRLNDEPFIDWNRTYTASQMIWIHSGSSWDIIAVKDAE